MPVSIRFVQRPRRKKKTYQKKLKRLWRYHFLGLRERALDVLEQETAGSGHRAETKVWVEIRAVVW